MTIRRNALFSLAFALPFAMTSCGGGGGGSDDGAQPELEQNPSAEGVLLPAQGLGTDGPMEGEWRVSDVRLVNDPAPIGNEGFVALEMGQTLVVENGVIALLGEKSASSIEPPEGGSAGQTLYYRNDVDGDVHFYANAQTMLHPTMFTDAQVQIGIVCGTVGPMHAMARVMTKLEVVGWAVEGEADPSGQRAYDMLLERVVEEEPEQEPQPAQVVEHGDLYGNQDGEYAADDVPNAAVTKLTIRSGAWIDSIETHWGSESSRHGGNGGSPTAISLADGEYITGLSGQYDENHTIQSLVVTTNLDTYGPYGASWQGYTPFAVEAPAGFEICGFRAWSSEWYLNAIGVLVRQRN